MSHSSLRAALALPFVMAVLLAVPVRAQSGPSAGSRPPVAPGANEQPAAWGTLKDVASWRSQVRRSHLDTLRLATARADSLRALAPVPGLPQTGRVDAPLVVEVFVDYQCPFCARQEQVAGRAVAEYERRGLVRTVYYDFPIPGHRNAWDAAVFSLCLHEQSREAWARGRSLLYERQSAWGEATNPRQVFAAIAKAVQANDTAALACYEAGAPLPVAQFGLSQALARRVNATPTYIVAGQPVRGGAQTPSAFAQVLEDALLGNVPPASAAPAWKARVGVTP